MTIEEFVQKNILRPKLPNTSDVVVATIDDILFGSDFGEWIEVAGYEEKTIRKHLSKQVSNLLKDYGIIFSPDKVKLQEEIEALDDVQRDFVYKAFTLGKKFAKYSLDFIQDKPMESVQAMLDFVSPLGINELVSTLGRENFPWDLDTAERTEFSDLTLIDQMSYAQSLGKQQNLGEEFYLAFAKKIAPAAIKSHAKQGNNTAYAQTFGQVMHDALETIAKHNSIDTFADRAVEKFRNYNKSTLSLSVKEFEKAVGNSGYASQKRAFLAMVGMNDGVFVPILSGSMHKGNVARRTVEFRGPDYSIAAIVQLGEAPVESSANLSAFCIYAAEEYAQRGLSDPLHSLASKTLRALRYNS